MFGTWQDTRSDPGAETQGSSEERRRRQQYRLGNYQTRCLWWKECDGLWWSSSWLSRNRSVSRWQCLLHPRYWPKLRLDHECRSHQWCTQCGRAEHRSTKERRSASHRLASRWALYLQSAGAQFHGRRFRADQRRKGNTPRMEARR